MVFEQPIRVPREATDAEREALRRQLERTLREITHETIPVCHGGTPPAIPSSQCRCNAIARSASEGRKAVADHVARARSDKRPPGIGRSLLPLVCQW